MSDPTAPSAAPQDALTSPPAKRAVQGSGTRTFLAIYNTVSAMLWLVVLGRTVGLYATVGAWKVHMGVGSFLEGTQSLAVLEVVFAPLSVDGCEVLGTKRETISSCS